MQYFKKTDLSKLYNVSIGTVSNWIKATELGKLDLTLYEVRGKKYIANITSNKAIIRDLVENGRKYRTSRAHKTVIPSAEFYEVFNERQVLEIINNLQVYKEVPRQFNYFGDGARHWDDYLKAHYIDDEPNMLNQTIRMLDDFIDLDYLMRDYDKVNIVDLGVGNGLASLKFVEKILSTGKGSKYTAVDLSPQMLDVALNNFRDHFGGALNIEGVIKDILADSLIEIIRSFDERSLNIVLFIGGTIDNFRDRGEVLGNICRSLGYNDLLITTTKTGTPQARMYFDFAQPAVAKLSHHHSEVFNLLNLDQSLYEIDMGFDGERLIRYVGVRFKFATDIIFTVRNRECVIRFNKNERITLLGVWDDSIEQNLDFFGAHGLELMQMNFTETREYQLAVYRLKNNLVAW